MRLHCDYDTAVADHRFGVVVLQSDEVLEHEFQSVFSKPDTVVHHARIPNATTVTRETLLAMADDLPRVAALLPDAQPLSAIAYGCTSASTLIGPEGVAERLAAHHPGVPSTNPISAVMAACAHLGVTRLALVTPYVAEVSQAMQDLLSANGFEITAFGSFEQGDDSQVARIAEHSVLDAICQLGRADDVEAVFASCTNLRSFGIIDEAERRIGKPVISSNHALAWHLLHLAGAATAGRGPGRLFAA